MPLYLPQNFVQTLHHVTFLALHSIILEPLVKLLGGPEDVRQQKIEQSPQFVQVVLQRCSC